MRMQIKNSQRMSFLFSIMFFGVVVFGLYFNTLDVPFYFDDADNVTHPDLRIEDMTREDLSQALSGGLIKNRPISNISFALNYYLGGYRVSGYHLVNMLIHLSTGVILYALFIVTLNFPAAKVLPGHRNKIAFWAALVWLVHPLATQSVTYVVQRMNSMSTMFYVAAMLFYILGRKQYLETRKGEVNLAACIYFFVSTVSGLFAMGSKEIAATLPVIIFLYEWFFFQNLSVSWVKGKLLWSLPVVAGLSLLVWVYTGGHFIQNIFLAYSGRTFNLVERLLTQLRIVVHYLSLMFFPHPDRMAFDYDYPLSYSFLEPITTLYSFLFLALLVAAAVFFATKYKLFSFCVLWFFINLLIESSFVPLEMVYEHRTYLPSMYVFLFAVVLVFSVVKKSKVNAILIGCIVVILAIWTVERNRVWKDPVIFWEDNVMKYPNKARSNLNLGVQYYNKKDYDRASNQFNLALSLKPDFPEAIYNLGLIAYRRGDVREAEDRFLEAIDLKRKYVSARMALASLYTGSGYIEKALEQYLNVYRMYPNYSVVNKHIGNILLKKGNPKEAIEFLNRAYLKKKDDIKLLISLGEVHLRLRNYEESVSFYEQVVEKDNNQLIAHYNLGLIYSIINSVEKAILHYQKAYMIQPEIVPVSYNYGNILLRNGEYNSAESILLEFVKGGKVFADGYNNLGLLYVKQGENEKALTQFTNALRVDPTNITALENKKLIMEILQ